MRTGLLFMSCWSLLTIPLVFIFSCRIARIFYRTLGIRWTVWSVLLMTWTVPVAVITIGLPQCSKVLSGVYGGIMRGITLGMDAVISIIVAIPVMSRTVVFPVVIVPLAQAIPVMLACLLSIMYFAIPYTIVIHRILEKVQSS